MTQSQDLGGVQLLVNLPDALIRRDNPCAPGENTPISYGESAVNVKTVAGELNRVKVLFQARAIAAAMGFPQPARLSATPATGSAA